MDMKRNADYLHAKSACAMPLILMMKTPYNKHILDNDNDKGDSNVTLLSLLVDIIDMIENGNGWVAVSST
jgi:hypothetical protein